jgi:hypothetical protein
MKKFRFWVLRTNIMSKFTKWIFIFALLFIVAAVCFYVGFEVLNKHAKSVMQENVNDIFLIPVLKENPIDLPWGGQLTGKDAITYFNYKDLASKAVTLQNDVDLLGLTYMSMCIISLGDSKSFCEDEGLEVLHSNENASPRWFEIKRPLGITPLIERYVAERTDNEVISSWKVTDNGWKYWVSDYGEEKYRY